MSDWKSPLKITLEEFRRVDPENGRALYLAAGMQVRLGDPEGARRNVEAALRDCRHPDAGRER